MFLNLNLKINVNIQNIGMDNPAGIINLFVPSELFGTLKHVGLLAAVLLAITTIAKDYVNLFHRNVFLLLIGKITDAKPKTEIVLMDLITVVEHVRNQFHAKVVMFGIQFIWDVLVQAVNNQMDMCVFNVQEEKNGYQELDAGVKQVTLISDQVVKK